MNINQPSDNDSHYAPIGPRRDARMEAWLSDIAGLLQPMLSAPIEAVYGSSFSKWQPLLVFGLLPAEHPPQLVGGAYQFEGVPLALLDAAKNVHETRLKPYEADLKKGRYIIFAGGKGFAHEGKGPVTKAWV